MRIHGTPMSVVQQKPGVKKPLSASGDGRWETRGK